MKHLLHFTDDGRLQPIWRPGTPWAERRRLARAFRAFAEGIDPRERRGYFRFDVDEDGNAEVGGQAQPGPGMAPRLSLAARIHASSITGTMSEALQAELERLLPDGDRR